MDSSEQEMLERARALHLKVASPPALKVLCLDFYTRKKIKIIVESFIKNNKKNIFAKFSNEMKNGILDHLLANKHKTNRGCHISNFLVLIHMLLNPKTVKLDICNLGDVSWCDTNNDDLRKMIEEVAQKVPKLQYFAIDEYPGDRRGQLIDPCVLPSIIKLKNLTHLCLRGGWIWCDASLSTLFQNLKKLIVLNLLLHNKVTEKGFKDLHLLKKLEEFRFAVTCEELEDKPEGPGVDTFPKFNWIYKWLAENASQLKCIGGTIEDAFNGRLSELQRVNPKFKDTRGKSKLEYLHSRSELPTAKFSNLRHLLFQKPNQSYAFVKRIPTFTHLTELCLCSLHDDDEAKRILKNMNGWQLSKLSLKDIRYMDFFFAFVFCPNLVEFEQSSSNGICGVKSNKSMYQAGVKKENFKLLKIFRHNDSSLLQRGLLELVLQAPLLEHLSVNPVALDKAHCAMFYDILEGQFSNLKTFHLHNVTLGADCTREDVNMMVKHMVSRIPNLKSLEIIFKDESLRPKKPQDWSSNSDPADVFNFWELLDHSSYN